MINSAVDACDGGSSSVTSLEVPCNARLSVSDDDDSTDDGTTKRIKSKNKVRNLPIDNFERRTNSF